MKFSFAEIATFMSCQKKRNLMFVEQKPQVRVELKSIEYDFVKNEILSYISKETGYPLKKKQLNNLPEKDYVRDVKIEESAKRILFHHRCLGLYENLTGLFNIDEEVIQIEANADIVLQNMNGDIEIVDIDFVRDDHSRKELKKYFTSMLAMQKYGVSTIKYTVFSFFNLSSKTAVINESSLGPVKDILFGGEFYKGIIQSMMAKEDKPSITAQCAICTMKPYCEESKVISDDLDNITKKMEMLKAELSMLKKTAETIVRSHDDDTVEVENGVWMMKTNTSISAAIKTKSAAQVKKELIEFAIKNNKELDSDVFEKIKLADLREIAEEAEVPLNESRRTTISYKGFF